MKSKVLDNVRDLFNELYYIYKNKYNEEKDGLNVKNKNLFYYKKMKLTNEYQYESEEEEKEEKEQQTSKKPDKKEPPENQQKMIGINLMNELMKKKQT